jgi:hypothetical protein
MYVCTYTLNEMQCVVCVSEFRNLNGLFISLNSCLLNSINWFKFYSSKFATESGRDLVKIYTTDFHKSFRQKPDWCSAENLTERQN